MSCITIFIPRKQKRVLILNKTLLGIQYNTIQHYNTILYSHFTVDLKLHTGCYEYRFILYVYCMYEIKKKKLNDIGVLRNV